VRTAKRCSRCRVYKQLRQYNKKSDAKDGKASACRVCTTKKQRFDATCPKPISIEACTEPAEPLHADVVYRIREYRWHYPGRPAPVIANDTGYPLVEVYRALGVGK